MLGAVMGLPEWTTFTYISLPAKPCPYHTIRLLFGLGPQLKLGYIISQMKCKQTSQSQIGHREEF